MFQEMVSYLKKETTKVEFDLLMKIFDDDIKFHQELRKNAEEEKCNILGQCYEVVKRCC